MSEAFVLSDFEDEDAAGYCYDSDDEVEERVAARESMDAVCETKSLQQLPGIYIFNKKVNIAQQVEDTLHACRPEPATRTLKLP